MLRECLEGLSFQEGGIYVDVTFGGGGHSRAMLEQMQGGELYSFDQDPDAAQQAERITDERFTFVAANFRFLKRYLKFYGVKQVDGILADLGISSHQIDEADRGFSIRFDGELDMRMDQQQEFSAKTLVNNYSEKELQEVLSRYGEVRNAKTLAKAIVAARVNAPLETSVQLKDLLEQHAPRHKEMRYFAQVFQALRIEVNDEMGALQEFLEQSAEVLKPGGHLVVMSYHSLEDRPVKNFINTGNIAGKLEKDFYGNVLKPLQAVTRKPIVPSAEEIAQNPRARSAKLRIAEKL